MSSPLLIATGNKGKLREFDEALASLFDCEGPPRPLEVEETGTTYHENAELKARAFYEAFKTPCLADDSGIEVAVIENRPGVYSARYGGVEISWAERWAKLMGEIGDKEKSARFVCVLCYFDGTKPLFFEGKVDGEICYPPRGDRGFGYDPVFYSPELGKSFGEASLEEKRRVSHRARALNAFLEWKQGN